MKTWEELTISFCHTSSFANENPFIHSALLDICDKLLDIAPVELLMGSQMTLTPHMMVEWYKALEEPNNEDDPRAVDIPKSKGSRDIEVPEMPSEKIQATIKD